MYMHMYTYIAELVGGKEAITVRVGQSGRILRDGWWEMWRKKRRERDGVLFYLKTFYKVKTKEMFWKAGGSHAVNFFI